MAGLWICLVNVLQGLNQPPVLNMLGLKIWQGCEDARVPQGAEYAWICLNNVSICVNIPQKRWIWLNMLACTWRKQNAEYARILDVSDAVNSIRSLYKLLSSYRDRRIQNTVKHIRWNVLQKEWCLSAGA